MILGKKKCSKKPSAFSQQTILGWKEGQSNLRSLYALKMAAYLILLKGIVHEFLTR